MSRNLNSTAYLILKPTYGYYTSQPTGFKISRVTQSKPENLKDGEVYIKTNVTVPGSVFDPVITANIDVPEHLVRTEADVEVRDDG